MSFGNKELQIYSTTQIDVKTKCWDKNLKQNKCYRMNQLNNIIYVLLKSIHKGSIYFSKLYVHSSTYTRYIRVWAHFGNKNKDGFREKNEHKNKMTRDLHKLMIIMCLNRKVTSVNSVL